jgi:type III secretion protein C
MRKNLVNLLTWRNALEMLLLLLLILVISIPSEAAEMRWKRGKVNYVAEKKDIKEFLREFAVSQGVSVSIDPEVKGIHNGKHLLTPQSMMELLAMAHGLVWYFDGGVLHVLPSTGVVTEVVSLKSTTAKELERNLDRLGISDSRYPINFDSAKTSILVSGPKPFVELVKKVAQTGGKGKEEEPNIESRIFYLKYAFAQDYSVQQGGKEFRIAGVASLLRQLHTGSAPAKSAPASRLSTKLKEPMERTTSKIKGTDITVDVPPSIKSFAPMIEDDDSSRGGSAVQAMFVADSRTNSIIVRDTADRMAAYESLIAQLDVKPTIVEIEASIVEVSSDDFSSLGIDWRFLSNRVDVQVGAGSRNAAIVQPSNAGVFPNPAVAPPTVGSSSNVAGAVLSAVLGNKTKLVARIAALEEKGKASTRAQPKVVTLNNVEAVIEATSTFYVPVQGFQDSQLFDISVGTSVRITPSVITENGKKDTLRLLIKIDDGSLTEQRVQQLPVIQRSSISTQTLLTEGTTLLIAGYSQEKEAEARTGVPIFSSLPFVGAAFRTTDKTRTKVERLFMITPRVVELVSEASVITTN